MGTLTDNYHIIKELGRGGMGAVYLATDKRLDRKVAIKMLQLGNSFNIEQTSEIISRFQKEARAVAKLAHPNIVGIHDIGEDNSQYYMVMEFLEGRSIGAMLEDEGSLPIEQCIDISIQMCKALTYIHTNSIVHRDIKPDNIVISSENIAKLTDFGIAQNETDQLRLTQDGAILGSIMYISPEQLRNSKDVDNRADIYSFGATLYQMLTGKLPFNGETVGEVVTKVLGEQAVLPRKFNPSIPFELEAIVMKAMNKERDKRYKSMEDMERDLQSLRATHSFKKNTVSAPVSGQPVSSTSPDISKSTAGRNNTIYSNPHGGTGARSTAVIIEKATSAEKAVRVFIKLVIALILVYLTFNLFSSMVTPDIASDVAASPTFQGAMIQGPYSRALVEGKVGTKAAFYCLLVVLGMLGFTAYSFPIEAKGLHRNFSLPAEVLPAVIVLVLTALYTFLFVAKSDTMKEYTGAYNKDSLSEIANFNDVTRQKGLLSYSAIDDYKRKFSSFILKKEKKSNVYDEATLQLKNNVNNGDHIKPNIISSEKANDPTLSVITDLMNNVFGFSEPVKELYLPKINQLAGLLSGGTVSSIPTGATYKFDKDPSTGKVKTITFEWPQDTGKDAKNKLVINPNSAALAVDEAKYIYPKATERIVNFNVQNLTDKPFLFLLYSTRDSGVEKNIVIEPKQNETVTIREGSEFQTLILFKEKTALPQSANYFFKEADTLKVDKIYYETPQYYSLREKTFPDNKTQEFTKMDLLGQNLFMTKDADIVSFKLTAPKKR
jgi:serine/threonine protein kinase